MAYRINGPVTIGDTATATIVNGDTSLPDVSTTQGELFSVDGAGNLVAVAAGTAGQVLTSNGAGSNPTFQAAAGGFDDNFSVLKVTGDSFSNVPTVVPNWDDTIAPGRYQAGTLTLVTATGVATAANAGKYAFDVVLNYSNTGASANTGSRLLELLVNGSPVQQVTTQPTGDITIDQTISMSGDILLAAADTISVRFSRSDAGTTNDIQPTSTWSMHRFV